MTKYTIDNSIGALEELTSYCKTLPEYSFEDCITDIQDFVKDAEKSIDELYEIKETLGYYDTIDEVFEEKEATENELDTLVSAVCDLVKYIQDNNIDTESDPFLDKTFSAVCELV